MPVQTMTSTPALETNTVLHSPTRQRRRRRKTTQGKRMNHHQTDENIAYESSRFEQALNTVTGGASSDADNLLRRTSLEYLEQILTRWARTLQPGDSENPWQISQPALVPFGSYRLGVHRADSDLDVLALCPSSYRREDFFGSFVSILRDDPLVSKVHPIPQAYTPVVKFVLHSKIHVDMLFARVTDETKLRAYQRKRMSLRNSSPSQDPTTRIDYIIDDSDVHDQDEAGVRSLNGARVSQILLDIVPDVKKYQLVLRAVKEWAVCKGIYSNVLGFLGGVNCAILVAWICRMYPEESPHVLLKNFFRTFSSWQWPNPVLLAEIQDTPPAGAPLVPAWNPLRYPRDGLHLMPIITPAYPSMNSSYNVGIPQLNRIRDEMVIASKSVSRGDYWRLFTPSDFFKRHKHFLQISIRASNEQDFLEWFRLVESRLRLLIVSLHTQEVHAWPYSCFFDRKYNKEGQMLGLGRSSPDCIQESCFFVGLRFAPGVDEISLGPLTSDFLHRVNSWNGRRGGMNLSICHKLDTALPEYVRSIGSHTKGRKKEPKSPSGSVSTKSGGTSSESLSGSSHSSQNLRPDDDSFTSDASSGGNDVPVKRVCLFANTGDDSN